MQRLQHGQLQMINADQGSRVSLNIFHQVCHPKKWRFAVSNIIFENFYFLCRLFLFGVKLYHAITSHKFFSCRSEVKSALIPLKSNLNSNHFWTWSFGACTKRMSQLETAFLTISWGSWWCSGFRLKLHEHCIHTMNTRDCRFAFSNGIIKSLLNYCRSRVMYSCVLGSMIDANLLSVDLQIYDLLATNLAFSLK